MGVAYICDQKSFFDADYLHVGIFSKSNFMIMIYSSMTQPHCEMHLLNE